jgi:membrane protein DedA with SNARE-associated domain
VTEGLLNWLAGLPTVGAYAVLILLSAIENVFPPVPADVAVALGAFLAQRTGRSPVLLGVLCWLANTVSSAGMYAVARAYGPEFFTRSLGRRLIPAAALETLRGAYARHGMAGIFVSRFLPGVRAGVTPFAGVVGLSPARALLPAAAASAIWYACLVGAATTLGLTWPRIRSLLEETMSVLGAVALVVAAAVVLWLWWRTSRSRALRSSEQTDTLGPR